MLNRNILLKKIFLILSLNFIFITLANAYVPISLDINNTLNGEWTTSSDISLLTNRYTTYYSFTLTERKEISLELYSLNHISKIYLLDSSYTIIQDSESLSSYDSANMVITLDPGTYVVDATTSNTLFSNELGTYTFRLYETTSSVTNIELNSTISNEWNSFSGVSIRSKRFANYYKFTLTESKDIIISLNNSSNMKLFLLDINKTVMKSQVGHVLGGPKILTHLNAGTYIIDATTEYGNEVGLYTLELHENSIINTAIDLDSRIYGSWTENSGLSPRSELYSNLYTFLLSESTEVVIDVDSCDYAKFYLLDENNSIVREAQNVACYEKARIIENLNPGIYKIDVTKQYNSSVGTYVLRLINNTVIPEEIILNSTINSEWTDLSPISNNSHRYAQFYTFTLDKTTDIYFLLKANNFTRLSLIDSTGNIMEYDDGSSSPEDARIITRLNQGTYILDVTTYFGGEVGDFILSYGENIINTRDIFFNEIMYDSLTNDSGYSPQIKNHAEHYTFTLTENKDVNITINNGSDLVLYLFDDNGDVLGTINSFTNQVMMKNLNAGKYMIEVTTGTQGALISYNILVSVDISVPNKITQLNIMESTAYNATINWTKNRNNTVGYKIYLNDKLVADVSASKNSYIISGLSPNNDYKYSIIAYNSAGESEAIGGTFKTKKDDYTWLVPIYHIIL